MTSVKLQISKFKALMFDGGTADERFLSESSSSYMLSYFVCLRYIFGRNRPRTIWSKFTVYLCLICYYGSPVDKLQAVSFQTWLLWLLPTSLKVVKTVHSITFYLQDIRLKDMLTCMKDLSLDSLKKRS
jgi:hypothetical protein